MSGNKLLMIVNEFPPTGQSGVQRALKFLKYACREGWEVHAVVPRKPVRRETDHSLLGEIPPQAVIHRVGGLGIKSRNTSRITSTRFPETTPKNPLKRAFWSLMKFLNDFVWTTDKQIGWMPFAFLKAAQIIRRQGIRNVYITAYPYSSFMAGVWLKKLFGKRIFWIADYRDAWQYAPLLDQYVLPFRLRAIARLDDRVLRSCDRAVFVTEGMRQQYLPQRPWLDGKLSVITNGYDEDDFEGIEATGFERFTLFYMGRMDRKYGDPLKLLRAVSECGVKDLQFVHNGNIDPALHTRIRELGYGFFRYDGYQSHRVALGNACGADINVMIRFDDPGYETTHSGKVFELLRAGRPILSVGPKRSVIADWLEELDIGKHAHIDDLESISAALADLLERPRGSSSTLEKIRRYSRLELTRQLLSLFPVKP